MTLFVTKTDQVFLDSFNYWVLINLPVFIGKKFKNHYMKNNGIKDLELKAEKDILMEIIWIFSIPKF